MSSESLKTFWGKPRLRFLVAGLIPFMCIFNATILQYKIIFALGGMVNHTMIENAGNTVNTTFNVDFPGTCISKDRASRGNLFDDGPFDWSPTIESVVVSAGLFGCMSGMAVALFIYDILDSRLIISSTFFIAGLLTIVTPPLATLGGSQSYVIVAATEFLVCALTSILTPEIPTLINNMVSGPGAEQQIVSIFLSACNKFHTSATNQFLFFSSTSLQLSTISKENGCLHQCTSDYRLSRIENCSSYWKLYTNILRRL